MREWMFEYYVYDCKECGESHTRRISLNIDTVNESEARSLGEGVAYHEVLRSCSPGETELLNLVHTGPAQPYNRTVPS